MSKVLCVVLAVAAGSEPYPEGTYGLKYAHRQREARREGAETFQEFMPSQEDKEGQQESGSESISSTRYRQRQRVNSHEQEGTSQDSNSDASGYRSVVLHDNPENQRPNVYHHTLRKKPTKPRQRQAHRESSSNYKLVKNTKPADSPPYASTILPPTTPVSGDPFVHAVHPSIMQNLLKQQPQTFDVPQEKETSQYEQDPNNWQSQGGLQKSNTEGLNNYQTEYGSQGDIASQQENYDVNKRPIYVPNRVSVHSPSSDTSFNVGYSIGFGSGLAQPPRMGIVQPPVNLRQGKQLSIPTSFHNVPVDVHIDGKNSVWKNLGAGVEMSHNVDTKFESPTSINHDDTSDRHIYSSGSVINQPIFFREGFDQNFNSVPTSGRNSFDHNHALQQSNAFDFSNAIDPLKNHAFSTVEKTNQLLSEIPPSFAESFPKQPLSSFTESYSKHPHSSYSETFSKESKPSFIRNQGNYETQNVESPQYTKAILNSNDHPESSGEKYSGPKYEKPYFSTSLLGSVRTPNSINLNSKIKSSEYSKNNPGVAKSSYSIKTFGNSNGLNSINDDILRNSFSFQNSPALPPLYSHPGRSPPGMVQAILVPFNSPSPSLPFPVGMPVLGDGYSPYFGHPVGMVRMPEPVGVNKLPQKEEFENTHFNINPQVENHQHQQGYHNSPMKIVQTQYVTRHQKEEASDTPHYHLSRPSHNPHQSEEDPERSAKFHRVYPTEAPDHVPSPGQSYSPSSVRTSSQESSSYKDQTSSFKEASPYSSFKDTTSPHYAITHHPRPYRPKKMIIVKRS